MAIGEDNKTILAKRIERYDCIQGPRVGDYCIHPDGKIDRITHDWGDALQTGGGQSSFYLGDFYISYSGGLDPGIKRERFVDIGETRPGMVWFFDQDIWGAGRGVHFEMPFRVFKITEENHD